MKPSTDFEGEFREFQRKVVILTALAVLLAVGIVFGGVSYGRYRQSQREARDAEAKQLVQRQQDAVKKHMAMLPYFRDTKQYKEIKEMSMVKISVEDLPATITAGLDPDKDPYCDSPEVDPSLPEIGDWVIVQTSGDIVGGGGIASNYNPNGWSFSSGGIVNIPEDARYGKYIISHRSTETCTGGNVNYYYTFKITPPCPTVTLTHVAN